MCAEREKNPSNLNVKRMIKPLKLSKQKTAAHMYHLSSREKNTNGD